MNSNELSHENIDGVKLKLKFSSSSYGSVIEEIHVESQHYQSPKWLLYTTLFAAVLIHSASTLTFLFAIFIIAFLIKLHWKVTKESLLIVKNVGIEITTVFASGRKLTQFIAWERIKGTVINEAITMHRVLFYLALLCSGPEEKVEIVPIFQHILPRLECLKTIYRRLRRIIDDTQFQNRVMST